MLAELNPWELPPGTLVRDWRIVRRIGKGGYAAVYEVEYEGKRYALKLATQSARSQDPKRVDERANREVACLKQLQHPHIVRMVSYGRWPDPEEGLLYIIQDFVEGYTLERWAEQTHFTAHELAVLSLKLLDAMDYMHQHGVFHRDLSALNILATLEGEPVIIDFGVADYATADQLTDWPVPPCTPRNRSPQALRFWKEHQHTPGSRYTFTVADELFALGATLYDLLTDPKPTLGRAGPPLVHELLPPPSPWKVTQGRVPAELSGFVMKLLSHHPEDRYSTAREARRPLEQFVLYEGTEWRRSPVHPPALQFPPEPPEGAPSLPPPRQAEEPAPPPAAQAAAHNPSLVPSPAPQPVQEAVAPSLPPAPPSPTPPAGEAASRTLLRRVWLLPMLFVPLALTILAGLALVLHRPAPPPPRPAAVSAPVASPAAASPLAEKPTSRPEQLPSPLPTQQEASPSVKQPGTTPTLTHGTPQPQQAPKARKRRTLSKAAQCALLIAALEWHAAGCAGVQKRPPPPEDCPEEAVRAMEEELGWRMGEGTQLGMSVDVTQPAPQEWGEYLTEENRLAVFKDGPVTGSIFRANGKAFKGMRLDGHLWTTGDRVYGRYVRAHLANGSTVPICVELQSGRLLGLDKEAGSKPGHVFASKAATGLATDRWR
jgi:serine/threonine protein kinase